MKSMEFWFEFASTYSYPAAMRIEAAAGKAGVPLIWKPFLLGPIFRAQGYESSPFFAFPVKGQYMWRDVERLCAKYGLEWKKPTSFPRSSILAARIGCSHVDAAWLPSFVRAVYHANFAEDRNIADDATIHACLRALDLDADAIIAHATSATEKSRLRERGAQALELGLFGAPSFIVDGELFWGNDRLEDALKWARR